MVGLLIFVILERFALEIGPFSLTTLRTMFLLIFFNKVGFPAIFIYNYNFPNYFQLFVWISSDLDLYLELSLLLHLHLIRDAIIIRVRS